MIDKLCMIDELELKPTDVEYDNIQEGKYHLSRVDVNEHLLFHLLKLLGHGYVLRVILQT